MTTAAAIDRGVHHALIVELTGPSVRDAEARARQAAPSATATDAPVEAS